MSHPFSPKGSVRQQLADLALRRIAEIESRRRELVTELRRLGAECTDLETCLVGLGVETTPATAADPEPSSAAPLRAVG